MCCRVSKPNEVCSEYICLLLSEAEVNNGPDPLVRTYRIFCLVFGLHSGFFSTFYTASQLFFFLILKTRLHKLSNTLSVSYQSLKYHPSMGNQIHNPLTKSLGKDSYHDYQSHLLQHHHKKEGSQTN